MQLKIKMSVHLFENQVFKEAVDDLMAIGVKISSKPDLTTKPYVVIGGRSNARWWLIPLENRSVATSGLALFQPLLVSAQLMKMVISLLNFLGLSYLWAWNKVYIAGIPNLASHFSTSEPLVFAYFTGTDSPHRKVAIQIMDKKGKLKGFAKLTHNPRIHKLLAHEAKMLEYVTTLGLQTAYVPKVLFFGMQGNSTLLVTDTLKTSQTSSTTRFKQAHRAFIQELAQKTANLHQHQISASKMAVEFRVRFSHIRPQLDQAWIQRLNEVISKLEELTDLQLPSSLSHGDFTPWNTFLVNDRLYVFDWEYAELDRPLSNDIIHFILNEPKMRFQSANDKIAIVMACLLQHWTGIKEEVVSALLMIYLVMQTLRQIERLPCSVQHITWDGSQEIASLIDTTLLSAPFTKMEKN